jgi:hypothetical protein
MSDELRALLDREEIRDRVARLARGEDRRDADALRAGFWPDAAVDFGIFAGPFSDYLAWVVPGAAAVRLTQHVLGQTVIDLDGATARAETQVSAYHRVDTGAGERDSVIGGRYLDRFERRAGDWRIGHRTMLYDWVQDIGPSVDWSQGLSGAPFSAPRYTGRATGDFSATFFAG